MSIEDELHTENHTENQGEGERRLMVPLAMRVTHRMRDRLKELSVRDGLSQLEHIRRAIDEYLDKHNAPDVDIREG